MPGVPQEKLKQPGLAPALPEADPRQAPRSTAVPMLDDIDLLIRETAYFKAQARNFAAGNEMQDWLEAETEVRKRLHSR